jgi:transposase
MRRMRQPLFRDTAPPERVGVPAPDATADDNGRARRLGGPVSSPHAQPLTFPAARSVGRPSKADPYRDLVAEQLARQPYTPSVEILRRARLAGYRGGKSALYALITTLRPRLPQSSFDGLPGESSQHGFGQADVRFADGARRRIRFFASRLTYSRWMEVSVVQDDRAETLARTLLSHFERFGGIPLLAVFDHPRTLAHNWSTDGLVAEWNAYVVGMALDLGLGLDIRCASGEPRSRTDNLVNWIKSSFFHARSFGDQADLAQQMTDWLTQVNTGRTGRRGGEAIIAPAVALQEERRRLRALKVGSAQLALRTAIVVSPAGAVTHDARVYLMPDGAAGLPGTLYLYPDRVRITAGPFEVTFSR